MDTPVIVMMKLVAISVCAYTNVTDVIEHPIPLSDNRKKLANANLWAHTMQPTTFIEDGVAQADATQ